MLEYFSLVSRMIQLHSFWKSSLLQHCFARDSDFSTVLDIGYRIKGDEKVAITTVCFSYTACTRPIQPMGCSLDSSQSIFTHSHVIFLYSRIDTVGTEAPKEGVIQYEEALNGILKNNRESW